MRITLALLLLASTAHAQSKKDKELAAKTPNHEAIAAPGTKPAPLINLYNEHTHEWLAVDPAKPPGGHALDLFLRDHYTSKSMTMEPRLLGVLVSAAEKFKSPVVDVVSGFRHPKFNLMLRKKGHQVARDSQHTHGNAVDFFVPGVTTQQLQAWAKSQKLGGVGLYLESGFVHMDTGPIRFWSGD
ncbi:MAG: YcbK family protein [Deltaproteobacteria bacterium]|nr:YcbK family protein [Deltaproteobacteria bacterium]